MKKPEELLVRLGLPSYTKRHLNIINDFIAKGEVDAKKLLNLLGVWDQNDLKITEDWLNEKSE